MRKTWVSAGAAVLVVVAGTVGVVAISGAKDGRSAVREPPPNTVEVVKGKLSSMVALDGTLTYRARADGSPHPVINQASGTYTELPDAGEKVSCGDVFYRVDDRPVLLLCGTVPAYRGLRRGDVGNDVGQLNRNLHQLGYDAAIDPDGKSFTRRTEKALEKLQRAKGFDVTGALAIDDAVILPQSVLIAKVPGELGGSAQPGTQVAQATSDTPEVQLDLEPSRQGTVKQGDRAQITLPDNTSVTGKVDRLGRVAEIPAGPSGNTGGAIIPAYITLNDPAKAGGLDRAPVQVEVTTAGVESALSVPVTALVGRAGGGFAVDVVRAGGRRELVAVHLGLFDTADGRVQVEGELHEGDLVVVPAS